MVSRALIQSEVDRWSELPEDSRGELVECVRSLLESEIPPEERRVVRGNETVDAVDYIITDLGSYLG